MKYFFFLLSLFLISTIGYSAEKELPKFKMGKVSAALFTKTFEGVDNEDDALIIYDEGNEIISYTKDLGWMRSFKHHKIIRIQKEAGTQYANIELDIYDLSGGRKDLINIKGYTYNLEGGKVSRIKLSNDNILREKVTDTHFKRKIMFPNVKEGSIIELEYTLRTDRAYDLETWRFQSNIPTVWSKHTTTIPEYFKFSTPTQGFHAPFHADSRTASGSISFGTDSQPLNYVNNIHEYVYHNLPALKPQKFSTALVDFYQQIRFNLNYYRSPGDNSIQNFLNSWEKISKELENNAHFGGYYLAKKGTYKAILESIAPQSEHSLEQVVAIYEYVKNNYQWNSKNRLTTKVNHPKKFIESQTGNAAEMNLFLAGLLHHAGYMVKPVLVSTRDHGRPNFAVPIIEDYNYPLVLLSFNNQRLFLDATSKLQPLGQVPFRCLSDRGQLLAEKHSQVIDIPTGHGWTSAKQLSIKPQEDGSIHYEGKIISKGYSALRKRSNHLGKENDEILEAYTSSLPDFEVESVEGIDLEHIYKPYTENISLRYDEGAGALGEQIYIPLPFKEEDNDFLEENRVIPLNFGCTMKDKYMYQIHIPEGYKLENKLEPVRVSFPDKKTYFHFTPSVTNNVITLIYEVKTGHSQYEPDQFGFFKTLYDEALRVFGEEIILTKTAL
ncbi:transglutaminase domain-containing protein [Persicobacter diffluens]|uniref:DUF3857 domain-containing protein n=1 Tax=Persicobacter diffluens TaxID=981 RepID=A0AAN5ALM6_9BACT|nr:hypothetical protein PEDI_15850 [Persicobacter diffluens]